MAARRPFAADGERHRVRLRHRPDAAVRAGADRAQPVHPAAAVAADARRRHGARAARAHVHSAAVDAAVTGRAGSGVSAGGSRPLVSRACHAQSVAALQAAAARSGVPVQRAVSVGMGRAAGAAVDCGVLRHLHDVLVLSSQRPVHRAPGPDVRAEALHDDAENHRGRTSRCCCHRRLAGSHAREPRERDGDADNIRREPARDGDCRARNSLRAYRSGAAWMA